MSRSCWLRVVLLAGVVGFVFPGALFAQTTGAPDETPPETAVPFAAPPGARITEEGWFATPDPKPQKPQLPPEVTKVFVIRVHETIMSKTYGAMRRKAVRCRASGAQLIVLDMNTFGGEVGAALDISQLLKTELKDIYTVCYVRTRAISAGALIAMACDEIIMTRIGKLGDCAPIMLGGKLEGVEREKLETVLRKEFAESARLNGYNVPLAESMVSMTREVWLVRNKQTRELRYVKGSEYRNLVESPPEPTKTSPNRAAKWELLRVVIPKTELLTVDSSEAKEYGFISTIIEPPSNERPLGGIMEHYNVVGEPVRLTDNWSERLVGFLTSPYVMGFLFFVAILCAYVEINTPGFGVPGAVAIACFAILFGSRFLVGLANWWEIAIVVVGVILILVEVFVTPGFGVLGISGILCVVIGLLAMLVANPPDKWPVPETELDWSVFTNGVLALAVGFLCSLVAIAIVARYLPKTPFAGRLILAPAVGATSPATEEAPIRSIAPGDIGIVKSPCRPVGQVRFGDHLVDAVTEGAFISPGTKVKVLKNEGNRVVVEPVE